MYPRRTGTLGPSEWTRGGGGGEGEEDGDDVLDSQEDGVLRDFRRGLATDEDVKEFPRACKGMSDDALGEYLHTLKAAVVDCPWSRSCATSSSSGRKIRTG
eukprot:jgi/Mesvir1/5782/Mv24109-RA.1